MSYNTVACVLNDRYWYTILLWLTLFRDQCVVGCGEKPYELVVISTSYKYPPRFALDWINAQTWPAFVSTKQPGLVEHGGIAPCTSSEALLTQEHTRGLNVTRVTQKAYK